MVQADLQYTIDTKFGLSREKADEKKVKQKMVATTVTAYQGKEQVLSTDAQT